MGKLQWAKKPADKKMTFDDANNYCKSLGEGWRLPTFSELQSIFNYKKERLKKPLSSNWYWSSTNYVDFTSNAWIADLINGYVDVVNKCNINYVWPVRDKT